jgi:flagellar motor switch protein FliN/FliY
MSSVRPAPDLGARSALPLGDDRGAYANPISATPAEASRPPALRGVDSLGFVMDVPVAVTVELGRRSVKIADILRLGPGSVLELDKANGEPLDLYVNDRLIARGEAVIVGERYGIRLTEVVIDSDGRRGGGSP